jgi:uncharacterized protein
MKRQVRLAGAILWGTAAAWAVDWSALKPQGCVSDFAGVVDAASKSQLETYCTAVQKATGAQIALVTIPSLQNEPVEDVTRALFRAWNLNGVLWLVATENRRDGLEAGRGLAAVFPDSERAAVLRQARPALARKQYAAAAMAAAEEIGTRLAASQHKTLAARLPRRAHRSVAESIPWLLAAGALLLAFWLFRVLGHPARQTRVAGGFGGDRASGW